MGNAELHVERFAAEFIKESERRLFDESVPRLKKCLAQLTEEEIWFRPNDETVSVGNLVLHLCGNARQWIVSGVGGVEDVRKRSEEFSERGPIATNILLQKLDKTMADVAAALDRLDSESLLKTYSVQGFQESGIGILMHVVEHFSYHVGQITYFVKSKKAIDLKYFEGIDLNKTSN